MNYPEFRDAEYSATDIPAYSPAKHYIHLILKAIILLVIFSVTSLLTYAFFEIVMSTSESVYINVISVGAAIATIFSAIISLLSLSDADCLKKYESDLRLLEDRYLKSKKISGWSFLHRYSFQLRNKQNSNNYYVTSACYKLYSGTDPSQNLVIVVPALEVDFYDVPCITQILKIQKFIPNYLEYINDEQKKFADSKNSSSVQPAFFIPLPYHLISLYRRILTHKILKHMIILCLLFIISAVGITALFMI